MTLISIGFARVPGLTAAATVDSVCGFLNPISLANCQLCLDMAFPF